MRWPWPWPRCVAVCVSLVVGWGVGGGVGAGRGHVGQAGGGGGQPRECSPGSKGDIACFLCDSFALSVLRTPYVRLWLALDRVHSMHLPPFAVHAGPSQITGNTELKARSLLTAHEDYTTHQVGCGPKAVGLAWLCCRGPGPARWNPSLLCSWGHPCCPCPTHPKSVGAAVPCRSWHLTVWARPARCLGCCASGLVTRTK